MELPKILELLTSSVIGIATGVISSYLFLIYFFRYKKPTIAIADHISFTEDAEGPCYWFKIINKTNCAVYNVEVTAFFMTPIGSDGGQNLFIEPVELKYSDYSHIPCRNKKDHYALHCVRVRCFEDVRKKWSKSSFLRIEVFAKHELSGFSKIFVRDYHKVTCIKNGEFRFGDDLTIA